MPRSRNEDVRYTSTVRTKSVVAHYCAQMDNLQLVVPVHGTTVHLWSVSGKMYKLMMTTNPSSPRVEYDPGHTQSALKNAFPLHLPSVRVAHISFPAVGSGGGRKWESGKGGETTSPPDVVGTASSSAHTCRNSGQC